MLFHVFVLRYAVSREDGRRWMDSRGEGEEGGEEAGGRGWGRGGNEPKGGY